MDSPIVVFCFALSILSRRLLSGRETYTLWQSSYLLHGLHALLKGDFRITQERDEWILTDVDMLKNVIGRAVRISLKLHQDYISMLEEVPADDDFYNDIEDIQKNWVITHEADPQWRTAVLSNVTQLLALRHSTDDDNDDSSSGKEYKIVTLNKKLQSFRIIKVNKECVRGLWSGQQQELIFLRNPNPERGSIQNAKQALRNMINSSCDQPIGYPIYVSPLTTSYSGTHSQLTLTIGGEFSYKWLQKLFRQFWLRFRFFCTATCASAEEAQNTPLPSHLRMRTLGVTGTGSQRSLGVRWSAGQAGGRVEIGATAGLTTKTLSFTEKQKPITTTAQFHQAAEQQIDAVPESVPEEDSVTVISNDEMLKVEITDPSLVYPKLNTLKQVQWPHASWRVKGGASGWGSWEPEKGMEGIVVHRWFPNHKDPVLRSHVNHIVYLVLIYNRNSTDQNEAEHFVAIEKNGVQEVGYQLGQPEFV